MSYDTKENLNRVFKLEEIKKEVTCIAIELLQDGNKEIQKAASDLLAAKNKLDKVKQFLIRETKKKSVRITAKQSRR